MTTLRIRLTAIAIILLLTVLARAPIATATTDTITLFPTEDALVSSHYPDTAHNGPSLGVRADQYQEWLIHRTYLKFDLSSIDCNRIASAALYLYCYSGWPPEPLPVSACQTADSWMESSLTWNIAPSIGDTIVTTDVPMTGGGGWHCWNGEALTDYVKVECVSDGTVSIVIKFPVEECTLYCSRSRSFHSSEQVTGHPYLELILKPSIESCDSNGARKDLFNWRDTVYANGSGYSPSSTYNLYILNDVDTWIDGMDIPAYVVKTQITSDASGKVVPTPIWIDPHTVGEYDILVDVDNNNKYNAIIDALDSNDIQVTSGFITVKPQYQLTIEVEGSGTTDPLVGDYFYDDESVVSVSATPSPGWRFEHWLLDNVNIGSPNPCEVIMNDDHVLKAIFTLIPQYNLNINVIGSGTTDPTPGDHIYPENTLVTVDAFPSPGWELDHWQLDGTEVGSANPYEVMMDSDHTLTAIFVELPPPQHELTIQVTGSGTTDPVPDSYLYDEGSIVPVHAFPSPCSMLDHWLLDNINVGTTNPIEVTMNENHVLVAVFAEKPPATIESCDSTGTKKDNFIPIEIVYANGSGYSPSTTYDLYLVNDVETWTDGMPIPPHVVKITVTSDSLGKVLPTIVWNPNLTPGKYDIVVDVDGDGVYDANCDALDSGDVQITAGLFVIPEYPFGAILGLAGLFSAFLAFRASKKRNTRKH